MGAQNALSHFAHFFCEMYVRLKTIGQVKGYQFELPMTQTELGDTLGMSNVHINRVLQDLRSRELLSWNGTNIEILDWGKLADIGMFDPTYLSYGQEPR